MTAITLMSHPGERALTGFGPTEYSLNTDVTPMLETVSTDRWGTTTTRWAFHPDRGILQGSPWTETFDDLEIDGTTLLFSGNHPFDDGGCYRPELIFTDGWVWHETFWGQTVAFLADRDYERVGRFDIRDMDSHIKDRSGRGLNNWQPVTGERLTRSFASILELDTLDGPIPAPEGVTVLDEALVREHLNFAGIVDDRLEQARKNFRTVAEKLRKAADDADRVASAASPFMGWSRPIVSESAGAELVQLEVAAFMLARPGVMTVTIPDSRS